jgi:hypothetical protein
MKYSIWNKWECGGGSRWTTPATAGGTYYEGTVCNVSGCNCNTLVKGKGQACNLDDAREWFHKRVASSSTPKPIEISHKYQRLVECVKISCESLQWKFEAKQEEDDLLVLTLDNCSYNVSRSGSYGEKHYVAAAIQVPATQTEPEYQDEMVIHETNSNPEGLLSYLIDTHFKEVRKVQAIQATYEPAEEKDFENNLEGA